MSKKSVKNQARQKAMGKKLEKRKSRQTIVIPSTSIPALDKVTDTIIIISN